MQASEVTSFTLEQLRLTSVEAHEFFGMCKDPLESIELEMARLRDRRFSYLGLSVPFRPCVN